VFTVEQRAEVREALIAMAQGDPRIVAGAEVGSLTTGLGDRWSDLDLTFGLTPGADPRDVLADWSSQLAARWGAVELFDLVSVDTLYRVFLFPGHLQVDLSVTPHGVAQMGPKFRMLFGDAIRHDEAPRPQPRELYGLCVHHALRARVSIERDRSWAAEYWICELRHEALALAAALRGLPARYARSFHELPAPVMDLASASLVRSVDRDELDRALVAAIELLLAVADDLPNAPVRADELRELAVPVRD